MMEKNCKQRRPCPFCGGNDYHVEYCGPHRPPSYRLRELRRGRPDR
ncbi:MAG: hypothetical protein BWY02_02569 [bacterium ADurb.Bin157]|nr:MAG: hypothetical protein BWY02_02569 [bacterium ADurb.Bin157]